MEITINGAKILYTIPVLGGIPITQTIVSSWVVMAVITGFCIWLTHDLKVENVSKRQAVAEMLVETITNFTRNNMGGTQFDSYIPFVTALFASALVSNLISLLGFYSPTADLSTEMAWALVVYALICAAKIRANGFLGFLKGYTTPIVLLTPLNIISDVATPISMAFRFFGNILSGVVLNALIYGSLTFASHALFGLLPGLLGDLLAQIPFLSVGVPAVLGAYFDWFSGCMQAFIFCTLTTMFIGSAAVPD